MKVIWGMILFMIAAPVQSQSASRTMRDVLAGMRCIQSENVNSGMNCEYRIGKDLIIQIAGVGQEDAAATVVESRGYSGDYYSTFGIMHGCMVVKPGTDNTLQRRLDMAFISPKTGKVYGTWQECGAVSKQGS